MDGSSERTALVLRVAGTRERERGTKFNKNEVNMGTKIDATAIAQPYRDDVKAKIAELKKNGIGRLLNT